MARRGTTYTLFFSLSILTDERLFWEMLAQTGSMPFHNLQQIDWERLGIKIRDTLMGDCSEIRERVVVKLFDDSLESATKGIFTERQIFNYLQYLVSRAENGIFQAHDLRTNAWLTTYTHSAPPQDFNGIIIIEDDGSEDILEMVANGMLKHFYTAGECRYEGRDALPMNFSGKLGDVNGFSKAMLQVFAQTFDHPFASDSRVIILNESQQKRIVNACSLDEL